MNVTFVGGGNMATALIGGLVENGVDRREFRVVEPVRAQQDKLAARFPGIGIFGEPTAGAVEGADLVVVAVKPQQMRDAAEALARAHRRRGRRDDDRRRVRDRVPLAVAVRLFAHRARHAQYAGARRRGHHGRLCGGRRSRPADARSRAARSRPWARSSGSRAKTCSMRSPESPGSGPAYAFYFLEGLEDAARELGFGDADARKLAYATFAGAIKLAQASDLTPATLRAQVTSKGGTTERAVSVLDEHDVKAKFVAAIKAAAARAKELGDEQA